MCLLIRAGLYESRLWANFPGQLLRVGSSEFAGPASGRMDAVRRREEEGKGAPEGRGGRGMRGGCGWGDARPQRGAGLLRRRWAAAAEVSEART